MLTRLFFLSWLTFMCVDFSFASEECPNQEKELAALKVLLKKTPEALAKHEAAEPPPPILCRDGLCGQVSWPH
jgi:hypothetical protein